MTLLYVVELMFAGVHVRVQVNGVEVVHDESAASKTIGARINPYVVEGENRLAVALRLPPADTPADPDFAVRLLRGVHGRDPGPLGRMLDQAWNAATDPLVPGVWKVVLNQPWTAPVAFGRWTWQDAPAAPPGPADRQDLLAEVAALHAAVVRRDGKALLDAHRLQHAELARAMGTTTAEFDADLAEALSTMFAASDFQVAPVEVRRLLLEPLAGGRLVSVRKPDGSGPVQATGGGEMLHLMPVYTQLGGRWLIAR